jgi:hypothetical protein
MLSVILFNAITLSTIVLCCSAEMNNSSVKMLNVISQSMILLNIIRLEC